MLITPENPLPFRQSKLDFPVGRQRTPTTGAKALHRFVFRRTEIFEAMILDQPSRFLRDNAPKIFGL